MIELLRRAASELPDHRAIVTPDREVAYAQLCRQAEAGAAALRERGIDRFALLEDDPAATWAMLGAASLAGVEACVYPLAADGDEIARFRASFGHSTLVTSRDLAGGVPPNALLGGTRTAPPPSGPPPARPLLVLTSGTSGTSKAAVHDWNRLLHASERVVRTPEQRWLLAYGLNQFGGLQILLHVAAAAATLAAGRSVRPRHGLAAMRRWGVTHASATPTFWRFLLAELNADAGPVPDLRQVTLSGEAVPPVLLQQLRARFPAARISQIFGATEMGQTITVKDGRAGLPLSFLDGDGEIVFKIVDGELWVRTRAAMLGYYGQETAGPGEWRCTGDLVEVVGDRIHFRGRSTEVINVGGVKVHPLPIEERVSEVDGVALARAFGRPNPVVGNIVALEVVPVEGADESRLRDAIRSACADLPSAARPRSIRFVPAIETTGNKLTRGERG